MIDHRAEVSKDARIGNNVTIGPWSVIGPQVEIGDGTWIGPHVVIKSHTKIGKNNKIYQFASVGEDTQDKKWKGEDTFLEIGDENTIREFCTINRGTPHGGGITSIGDHNLFMAYVHIAHDCKVGNHNTFANNAALSGHVIVEDYVGLGGFSGVHQFCTLGSHSFLGGVTFVGKDVLPYILVFGTDAKPCGLNFVGLKRRGFSADTISYLKKAYKIIFNSEMTIAQTLEQLVPMVAECAEIQALIDGIKKSERGIVR